MLAPAASTPRYWDFTVDPALVLILAAVLCYWLGTRRTFTPLRKRRAQHWRTAAFFTSLAVLAIALDSAIDLFSAQLFWVHMVQHVLLMMVAAPLLVLSSPWIRLWRVLPLGWRRSLARGLSHSDGAAPLRAISRFLGRPVPAFVLFCGVLLAWHIPAFFDATLRSESLHAFEHTLFFATALLFWKQVIPSPPLHARLTPPARVIYAIGAMIVSWALAVVLALAPHPLYDFYAHEASRPGGISALADQQLAAGIMWVPGSIAFLLVVFAYVHRWLLPAEPGSPRAPRLASEH